MDTTRRATQRRATEIRVALSKLNELLRNLPDGMIVEPSVSKPTMPGEVLKINITMAEVL